MACQREHPWRPALRFTLVGAAVFTVLALAAGGAARAQGTVYIGGSGLPPVVVNLGAIDAIGQPFTAARALLDPPGTAPRSAYLYTAPPAAVATAAFTVAAPAALPALTLAPAPSLPMPEPQPMVTAEPLPLPELVAEPETAATLTFEPPPLPEPEPLPEPSTVAVVEPPEPEPMPEPVAEPLPEPVAEPPPPPEPVAAPEPEPEVAALSPAVTAEPGPTESLRIAFDGDSAELPAGAADDLKAIADKLLGDESLRAQVKAYAGAASGSASAARRLSLSRALAVRAILIEQGVRSTRIDVRALGDRNEGGPPERVDVLLVSR